MLKPPSAPNDDMVLEQLGMVEQKLAILSEELAGKDLDTIRKEMEHAEFRHIVEEGAAIHARIDQTKSGSSKHDLYSEDISCYD